MLFLIDYENVGNAGMKGYEYLTGQDHVIVFYSGAQKHMERRMLEAITSSGCVFEICALCRTGKNALDFYIASRLGELTGEGLNSLAVIVSGDGGFQAVRDYWEKRALRRKRVVLSSCIEDGIVSGNENSERVRTLRHLREKLAIGEFYADYEKGLRVRKTLCELFAGTEYEGRIDEIQNMIDGKEKSAKIIYLSSLHLFGRKGGLEIYNRIKASTELAGTSGNADGKRAYEKRGTASG